MHPAQAPFTIPSTFETDDERSISTCSFETRPRLRTDSQENMRGLWDASMANAEHSWSRRRVVHTSPTVPMPHQLRHGIACKDAHASNDFR
mgnify:CR=1 FL=1